MRKIMANHYSIDSVKIEVAKNLEISFFRRWRNCAWYIKKDQGTYFVPSRFEGDKILKIPNEIAQKGEATYWWSLSTNLHLMK